MDTDQFTELASAYCNSLLMWGMMDERALMAQRQMLNCFEGKPIHGKYQEYQTKSDPK